MAINPLNNALTGVGPKLIGPTPLGGADKSGGQDFSKVLMDSINEVNRLQAEATDATQRFADEKVLQTEFLQCVPVYLNLQHQL